MIFRIINNDSRFLGYSSQEFFAKINYVTLSVSEETPNIVFTLEVIPQVGEQGAKEVRAAVYSIVHDDRRN